MSCYLDFSYPCLKQQNRLNNRLHECCLRIIYSNILQNFEVLLHSVNSLSIHLNNIHALATEIYKFANGMFPEFMNKVFKKTIPITI